MDKPEMRSDEGEHCIFQGFFFTKSLKVIDR